MQPTSQICHAIARTCVDISTCRRHILLHTGLLFLVTARWSCLCTDLVLYTQLSSYLADQVNLIESGLENSCISKGYLFLVKG